MSQASFLPVPSEKEEGRVPLRRYGRNRAKIYFGVIAAR